MGVMPARKTGYAVGSLCLASDKYSFPQIHRLSCQSFTKLLTLFIRYPDITSSTVRFIGFALHQHDRKLLQ